LFSILTDKEKVLSTVSDVGLSGLLLEGLFFHRAHPRASKRQIHLHGSLTPLEEVLRPIGEPHGAFRPNQALEHALLLLFVSIRPIGFELVSYFLQGAFIFIFIFIFITPFVLSLIRNLFVHARFTDIFVASVTMQELVFVNVKSLANIAINRHSRSLMDIRGLVKHL